MVLSVHSNRMNSEKTFFYNSMAPFPTTAFLSAPSVQNVWNLQVHLIMDDINLTMTFDQCIVGKLGYIYTHILYSIYIQTDWYIVTKSVICHLKYFPFIKMMCSENKIPDRNFVK